MDTRSILLVAGLAALAACPRRSSVSPAASGRVTATVADAATPGGAQPAAVANNAAARALVAQWLAAQNQGDFTAYQGLYATRFEGVRRSGAASRRMDRAGWMRERREMFTRAQRVTAEGVAVAAGPADAVVRFTQTWASGTYHDEGPKVLVLVADGPTLKITREELLRSRVEADADAAPPLAPGSFLLALPEAPAYLVLPGTPDGALARGAPTLVARDSPVTTREDLDPARLPASVAALLGRAVQLYGPSGPVCTGRLGAPAVVHRVDVHFGTRQRWEGTFETPHTHPLSAATIARDAWAQGAEGALLTATVDAPAVQCAGARWARLADLPPVAVYARSVADPASAALALARFRTLPAWTRLQTEYGRDPEAHRGGRWDAHQHGQPETWAWRTPGSPRSFVTVNAAAVTDGCRGLAAGA